MKEQSNPSLGIISGLRVPPEWAHLLPGIFETIFLDLISANGEKLPIRTEGQFATPAEATAKDYSAGGTMTVPTNLASAETLPLASVGLYYAALIRELQMVSSDMATKTSQLMNLAETQRPFLEPVQKTVYQANQKLQRLDKDYSTLINLRQQDIERIRTLRAEKDLLQVQLKMAESGGTSNQIRALEEQLKKEQMECEQERQVLARKLQQQEETVRSMSEAANIMQQTFEEEYIAKHARERILADLRLRLTMAEKTALNKAQEADQMQIQVDRLTARIFLLEPASTPIAAIPGLVAAPNTPEAPQLGCQIVKNSLSRPSTPLNLGEQSDDGKYLVACAASPPPGQEEPFFEAQGSELGLGAEAKTISPQAMGPKECVLPPQAVQSTNEVLPNPLPPGQAAVLQPVPPPPPQSRFDFKTLPSGDQEFIISYAREGFCVAESSAYPYLRVAVNKTTKFMGPHCFDPYDFTLLVHPEDTCRFRGLSFQMVDEKGYAYYLIQTLLEISHIRQDDSGGETVAWATMDRAYPNGSYDFRFSILPPVERTLNALVTNQRPELKPQDAYTYSSVFIRVAFSGPTQNPTHFMVSAFVNTQTFYSDETIRFPVNKDIIPGYLLAAHWIRG
ncbi:MAG: hypothetical protein GY847_18205 [Proteobacteria bacterium]|nr:hypothetical protein [Pseudomonadota bacterium]